MSQKIAVWLLGAVLLAACSTASSTSDILEINELKEGKVPLTYTSVELEMVPSVQLRVEKYPTHTEEGTTIDFTHVYGILDWKQRAVIWRDKNNRGILYVCYESSSICDKIIGSPGGYYEKVVGPDNHFTVFFEPKARIVVVWYQGYKTK